MKTTKYNRSEIMKRAWSFYRHHFTPTFAAALRRSWQIEKQRVAEKEAKRNNDNDRLMQLRNIRQYQQCVFGKNDYQVSYGQHYAFTYRRRF